MNYPSIYEVLNNKKKDIYNLLFFVLINVLSLLFGVIIKNHVTISWPIKYFVLFTLAYLIAFLRKRYSKWKTILMFISSFFIGLLINKLSIHNNEHIMKL